MEIPQAFEQLSWVATIAGVLGIPSLVIAVFRKIRKKRLCVKSNTPMITILGRWNLALAESKVINLLERHPWSATEWGLEPPLVHRLAGHYHLVYRQREGIVLVFATANKDFDCHPCAPHLSFLEFENVNDNWSLVTADIGVFQAGSWGQAPRLSVRVIGDERFAVFMEDGYTAQGWTVSSTTILTRIGDAFKEVLCILDSELFPEGEGWNSKLETITCLTGLYDVRVTRWGYPEPENMIFTGNAGERLKRDDVATSDDKIRAVDTFRFNGQQYVRVVEPNVS